VTVFRTSAGAFARVTTRVPWFRTGRLPRIDLERHRWQAEYTRRLCISDISVIVVAVLAAQVIRFGFAADDHEPQWARNVTLGGYTIVSAALAAVWIGFLMLGSVWSPRLIGRGLEEYRGISYVTFRFFGLIAITSLLLRVEFARGYLAIALPMGLLGLMANRSLLRRHAARQRISGRYYTDVLVLGCCTAARDLQKSFGRDPGAGHRVVGLYLLGDRDVTDLDEVDVPVFTDADSIADAVCKTRADTVAVAAIETMGHQGIRSLLWQLLPLGVDLVVTPGIVDVADQRLQMRPVGNLPLLHIDRPQFDRAMAFGKAAFDIAFATAALLVFMPVMLAAAVAVKLDSGGPVFYLSERIGLNGEPFRMIKFRSMYPNSEAALELLRLWNDGAGPLFKMREDPRVTNVGRLLRKYSLDELPQFFNVLTGHMSVVGPRPPLRAEVERYDPIVRRRLLVKPGLTGLWQVSGRSNLPWEEAVRLDQYYIENWSMVQDLIIIKKTIAAVVRSDGAY
jgi:exopolysaccharide biosynthesis polyprenyl glycosylphosphotransferase